MRNPNALPITPEMIRKNMSDWKADCGEDISYEESELRLNRLADRGCLMHDDCRSCPLFHEHNKCPV